MRIQDGFELREVCGENIVLATGQENMDFSRVITLNDTAAYLWRAVQGRDFTADDLVELLLAEYEVDRATATADIAKAVEDWREAGFLLI